MHELKYLDISFQNKAGRQTEVEHLIFAADTAWEAVRGCWGYGKIKYK